MQGFFELRRLAVSALIGAAFAAAPEAAAADVRCDFCTTEFDYSEQAKYLGDGSHVIYNLSTFQAYSFYVSGWGESPIDFDAFVHVVPTGPTWQNEMHHLQVIAAETGGTMTAKATVRLSDLGIGEIPPGTNAYDIVRNAEFRGRIEQYLSSHAVPGISAQLSVALEALRTLATAHFFGTEVSVEVIVETSDGKVVFKRVGATRRFDYQPGRSTGRNGHTIPENISEAIGGSWTSHGGNDLDGMLEYLETMQGTTIFVPGQSAPGTECEAVISKITVDHTEGGTFFTVHLICD